MRRLIGPCTLLLALTVIAIPVPSNGAVDLTCDFNGDGFSDLAVGAIGKTVNGQPSAGAVTIIYGTSNGPASAGAKKWTQASSGVAGAAEAFDFFGVSLACGNFDGDDYDDLAVGISDEEIGSVDHAGAVQVFYGSSSGIAAARNKVFHENSANMPDSSESWDQFGLALASGDFDGDGYDDVAIGVPGESIGGAVHVLYGSGAGITTTDGQYWHKNVAGMEDSADSGAEFGSSLTAGDFDGDGKDDLAVGVKRDTLTVNEKDAGSVSVIYGTSAGLAVEGNQFWHQNQTGVLDKARDFDFFGFDVVSGDFNGDGYEDLAAAVRGDNAGSEDDAGKVNVLYGSAAGLTAGADQLWHQDKSGVRSVAEADDRFGWAVAAGDFDNDGYTDLAISAQGENRDGKVFVGIVHVLYGSESGLTATGDDLWAQGAAGVKNKAESNDVFGASLSSADFDGDGFADLVIAATGEDIGAIENGGIVHVLFGSATGVTSIGDQVWKQGVAGKVQENGVFGSALP